MRCLFLLLSLAAVQDWPQLLGPNRDGIYRGGDISLSAPRLVWKREVGEEFSAPVVAGGRILTFVSDGEE